ncbi:MAG: undecaprenyl/decaprenyl-phosphate alpha-N-acetylglucosaminyl 1-phosphate transferase [Eubacteriaceae bacterium]|nr:undecaprenyl/decaprenyl-phosphate alpha-N-acetylglucosaminyl 1-phosphate transferase [Eubacteriaceae bacterium]
MIYLTCLGLSILMTPIIAKIAIKIGAVDKPNKRKVHTNLMPTLGGLAIYISFFIGHLLFKYPHFQFNAIFIGSLIIVVTGIFDDVYDLSPKGKLAAQFIAASIVIFYGQLHLETLELPIFGLIELGYFGYLFTYIWIIGITNAINLIDGLDGLASGVASITFLTMYVMAVSVGDNFVMTYTLILAGCTSGFLVYNFHPAKIFMGDTGALFLGYIISVMSLMGFENATFISFVVPILILGVPVFDTLFAIIRRKLKDQSVTQADKEHLHHLLMGTNRSQTKTVLIIYGISILFSLVAIIYSRVSPELGIVILIAVFIIIEVIAGKIGLLDKHFLPFSKIFRKLHQDPRSNDKE